MRPDNYMHDSQETGKASSSDPARVQHGLHYMGSCSKPDCQHASPERQVRRTSHGATVEAGMKRIRPALMTASTAILALIPVLTSTGRGSDVMVPMALPLSGGMLVATITIFAVPSIYCLEKEIVFKWRTESAN